MTTRINTGLYSLIHAGKTYEVERYPDGSWLTFVVNGSREYLSDFATKRAAIASVTRANRAA
jgi:hypothetical protein